MPKEKENDTLRHKKEIQKKMWRSGRSEKGMEKIARLKRKRTEGNLQKRRAGKREI